MVSKLNYVINLLLLLYILGTTTSRINHKKYNKSFLQTEELKEKKLDEEDLEEEKKLDKELKASTNDEWDNNSLVEIQLANFLTEVTDTNSELLVSVKQKENKLKVKEENGSIWKLTPIEKNEDTEIY